MSNFDKYLLTNKIAIVTGGGRGIGKAIALEYAKAGANVVVASRNQENIETVAAEIRALGRESLAVATDIRVPEQVDNMVKQAMDKFGRIDILVNNAGVGDTLRIAKPEEALLSNLQDQIAITITGTFLCSTAVGKVMIEQKSGKIVNIASVVGIYANPLMLDYSTVKAGMIRMTVSLAYAWADHNINVNCIAPGAIYTERHHTMVKKVDDSGNPIPRLRLPGTTEDVANLALFLASEASRHISGETIGIMGVMRH